SPASSTPSGFAAIAGYLPLRPAHPGRPQDDGPRQVSWLAGSVLSSVFPTPCGTSDTWTKARRRQLRGQPRFSRVPYTLHLGGLSARLVGTSSSRNAWLAGLTGQSSL